MKILKKALCTSLAVLALAGCPTVVSDFDFINAPVSITAEAYQNRSSNFNKKYTLTGNYAKDIVAIAKAQLGKSGGNLGYSEHWCADFVCDSARLTKMKTSIIPYTTYMSCNCNHLYKSLVNNYNAKTVSTPKVGDIVFFDWDGYKNTKDLEHVAIVASVSGNKITYIGGNQGSGTIKTRKVTQVTVSNYKTYRYIAKFVRPNYTTPTPTPTPTPDNSNYYPKYTGKTNSIVDALKSLGIDSSSANRKKIASANGISNYSGTASQNIKMLNLLKQGKLIKAGTTTEAKTYSYTIKSSSGAKVRKEAGTSKSVVGGIAKGSVVKYDKTKKANGYTWMHIVSVKAKSGSWGKYSGWVAMV